MNDVFNKKAVLSGFTTVNGERKPVYEFWSIKKINRNLRTLFNERGIVVKTEVPVWHPDENGIARQTGTREEYRKWERYYY